MSIRILGGSAKGRSLKVPDSARPSGARIRKSLFDLLATRAPTGSFLDLHGGSGAVGLEAASRGYRTTLIEKDPRAVRALETNARILGLEVRLIRGDALAQLAHLPPQDIVFSDPPYAQDIGQLTLKLFGSGIVKAGGLLICQHSDQLHLSAAKGYSYEERKYGSNILTLYRRVNSEDLSHE